MFLDMNQVKKDIQIKLLDGILKNVPDSALKRK